MFPGRGVFSSKEGLLPAFTETILFKLPMCINSQVVAFYSPYI